VSGHLHAPAALLPGKEPPVPIGQEAGWAPELVWTIWRKLLTLPGLELPPFSRPARSQSLSPVRVLFTETRLRYAPRHEVRQATA
jgi:hypothetical protein